MSGSTTHDQWQEDEVEAARQAHVCFVWSQPSDGELDRCAVGCQCKTRYERMPSEHEDAIADLNAHLERRSV